MSIKLICINVFFSFYSITGVSWQETLKNLGQLEKYSQRISCRQFWRITCQRWIRFLTIFLCVFCFVQLQLTFKRLHGQNRERFAIASGSEMLLKSIINKTEMNRRIDLNVRANAHKKANELWVVVVIWHFQTNVIAGAFLCNEQKRTREQNEEKMREEENGIYSMKIGHCLEMETPSP